MPTFFMGFGSSSFEGLHPPPFDKDYIYLAILPGHVLEDELGTLARYTRRASSTLALGVSGY